MIRFGDNYKEYSGGCSDIDKKIQIISDMLVEDYVLGKDMFINISDVDKWDGGAVVFLKSKPPSRDWHGRLTPNVSLSNVADSIRCNVISIFNLLTRFRVDKKDDVAIEDKELKVYVLSNRNLTIKHDREVFPILTGGFGNQVFQLFYSYILSGGVVDHIMIDRAQYLSHKYRDIDERLLMMFDGSVRGMSGLVKIEVQAARLFNGIYRRLFNSNVSGSFYNLFFDFSNKYPDLSVRNKYVMGYFQNSNFIINNLSAYSHFVDEVMSQYVVSSLDVDYVNELAISMRLGGDYIKSRELNICGDDYYAEAIGKAIEKRSFTSFRLYSDNIEKAVEIIDALGHKVPVLIGDHNDIFQSFYNLCKHRNIVISNSSFSWLAAAYRCDDKDVYMPSRWSNVRSANNMLVDGWEIIDV